MKIEVITITIQAHDKDEVEIQKRENQTDEAVETASVKASNVKMMMSTTAIMLKKKAKTNEKTSLCSFCSTTPPPSSSPSFSYISCHTNFDIICISIAIDFLFFFRSNVHLFQDYVRISLHLPAPPPPTHTHCWYMSDRVFGYEWYASPYHLNVCIMFAYLEANGIYLCCIHYWYLYSVYVMIVWIWMFA